MTDSTIKWEWEVLHAPVSALADAEVRIPRGSPKSAPFNHGSWFIQLSEDDGGKWELTLRVVGLTVHPNSVEFEYKIRTEKGNKSVEGQLEGGSLVGLSETEWSWDVAMGKEDILGFDDATLDLGVSCPALQQPSRQTVAHAATANIAQLMSSRQPFDVRFSFPKTKQSLWASSKALVQESPYFSDLFLTTPLNKQHQDHDSNGIAQNGSSESSKREHLELTLDSEPSTLPGTELAFYSITVTSPGYSAFRAVLLWIATHQIIFASSSTPTDQLKDDPSTSDADSDALNTSPKPKRPETNSSSNLYNLPTITWTAAFRAAYALKLPALADLALEEYANRLTVDNVARELFGKLSATFLDVREVGLKFAVANWAKVRATEGMGEMQGLAKAGKMKKGAEIAMELARRLT